VAARRADQLLRDGDKLGAAMWVKIWRAIKALQSEKPREGEAVN
jgi:hypothetical protein